MKYEPGNNTKTINYYVQKYKRYMQWRIHDFPSNLERTPTLYFCHNFGEKSLQLKKDWSILRGIRLLRPWNEAMACGNLLARQMTKVSFL